MINKVILVGNLGAAPEIRRTQDGRAVATFSLATSERWTDRGSGEKRERTEWHRVVIFNEALVKIAEQYLKKGSRVYLEGKNQTRDYTDKDGVKRLVTEVVLAIFGASLVLCDRAGGERAPAPAGEATGQGLRPGFDDEIPF